MSGYRLSNDWEDTDVRRYVDGCIRNGMHPLHGLACMFNESDALASDPRSRNPRDLSKPAVAVGLIQFTHAWLGEHADLDAFHMKPTGEQLVYVERYFAAYRGKLVSVELVYLSMFIPWWIDRRPTLDTILCAPNGPFRAFYGPNKSLDGDEPKKGFITLLDLQKRANAAAQGARWNELSGRVRAAMQDRPTDPVLPNAPDGDGTLSETGSNDDEPGGTAA